MRLAETVALVTGGASGLGRAVVERFEAHCVGVAVLDRDAAAVRALAAGLPRVLTFPADITDAAAVEQAVAATVQRFGALHVAVNAAGVSSAAKIVTRGAPAALRPFADVVAVNLTGAFNVTRVAAAAMLRNRPVDGERGVVINTASIAAFDGQIGQAAYSASKAGVVGMTLPVARDLAGTGVRINAIAPGLFDTPMTSTVSEAIVRRMRDCVVEPRRLGRPDEFAALVEHIVTNGYLNGACIRLDGAARLNIPTAKGV